ncbi:MAG: alpha/beta fold hydrolase [Candidatus Eremiobacteraeota bacterium]|nr:alpha/beta fold hydrolase [Candidatus Eremiobacteraeota bacterium]
MRARLPDRSGYVTRDGTRLYYELFGAGERTVVFLPTWSIIHSRHWKAQIPYFARHFRVLTFDGRGNGLSDRPAEPRAYDDEEFAFDALAVMDANEIERATIVALSAGSRWALILAARYPERIAAAAFIGPNAPLGAPIAERAAAMLDFDVLRERYQGWQKYNRNYWRLDQRDFLEFFFSQAISEPHSTKQIEDCVGWGMETTPETLIATQAERTMSEDEALDLAAAVRCPVLVVNGDDDRIVGFARAQGLARATGGKLLTLVGSGHLPHARDPVAVNLALRAFIDRPIRARTWRRGRDRRKRALFISSPIGLGHAQRDVAIARELRKLHPDLEVDWLAQHPVTRVLEASGERIHPASALLANESAHIEDESGEHDLHCFQALRRMDEILIANFMLFHDVVSEEHYDLWIGDEAWELDYYLHENPELKRAPYAWLTDFVGYLPMPEGGRREAFLTADYNAEMIEHVERYRYVRDRAIFVGNPEDVVPETFGAGLPAIRDWTENHYQFSGYVTGFEPVEDADRAALRARFGYRDDEQVCIVTVGGSGVGAPLLRRILEAHPHAKARLPALRMIVVAGPRIELGTLPSAAGVEIHSFVPHLYQRLAACDIAIVQGGLTTTMELTAHRRPFLYFPLHNHFEQNFHVRYRLERYGAGRCMRYDECGPEQIAEALVDELGRTPTYRPVESDGAAKAAALIAALV